MVTADGRPLYSVLLPTHNRADLLRLSIGSVLEQSEESFEILVVADGCTDNTADVVNSFGDPRIRLFDLPKAPNFGYANRNVALKEARGELVAFMADDNIMFPDHLHRMAQTFTRPAVQWAYSRPLWVRDDGLLVPFFVNLRGDLANWRFMNEWNPIPATNIVHRLSAYADVGYWPEDVKSGGDYVLWKRILGKYGRGSIGIDRMPTCLHFRAGWRKKTKWGPMPLRYLFALADENRDWPGALKLGLDPQKGSPQAQVAERLRDRPGRFTASIRRGVNALQDQLAWEA
ncbi:MAG: glycosyltransferase family A protein, partial [Pseudomonadota bacterium]